MAPRKCGFMAIGGNYYNIPARSTAQSNAFAAAGMPISNLATEEPTEYARITTLDPLYSFYGFTTIPYVVSLDGAALINTNHGPDALFRIRGLQAPVAGTAPDGIVGGSSTNITGTYTDVDETIETADGLVITPTVTTINWRAHLTFATPGSVPATGANKAYFVMKVGLGGVPTVAYPYISASLYESGVLKLDLGKRAVINGSQILIFPFDPAVLATASGANIEIRVSGDPGSPNSSYCFLDAVRLYTESVGTADPYDTGWVAAGSQTYVDPYSSEPTKMISYLYAARQAGMTRLYVYLLDDQTSHLTAADDTTSGVPVQTVIAPTGYMQAGVLVAGPALFLTKGWVPPGPEAGIIVDEENGVTVGGQTYGADSFRRRELSGSFYLTRAEKDLLMDLLDWRRGRSGAFYLMAEPDLTSARARFMSFWATVSATGRAVQVDQEYDPTDNQMFTKEYTFEEKL